MLVSVLMSVYNEDSRYIKESIDSILCQTYRDFEFIIVGDSPASDRNRVFKIIKEYEAKDRRIVFLPNKENIGLTKSLNIGLNRCNGKYVVRMDADDISLPTRLEKQVSFMESNPTILASSAWYQHIDKDGNILDHIIKTKADSNELRLDILKNSVLGHPISIFHRIINDITVKYDESAIYAQDYSLWVWILQYGNLSNIQEVLLYYRITSCQITSSRSDKQRECAKIAQRNAFRLYDFPIVESFMDVFSAITIEHRLDVPYLDARIAFCNFFGKVSMKAINYEALRYLAYIYIRYFLPRCGQNTLRLIFGITRRNPKFAIKIGYEYMISVLKRILLTPFSRLEICKHMI